MEISVVPTLDFQKLIDASENRIDLWNENRPVLFELAKNTNDRKVKRAYDIWKLNLHESIDDPKYGDELFDALFCVHHKMHGKTPHFFYKHMVAEHGRIVYENVILRKDMCGHKKWSKHKKITFDGVTHEFRIKNEDFGYPISVI